MRPSPCCFAAGKHKNSRRRRVRTPCLVASVLSIAILTELFVLRTAITTTPTLPLPLFDGATVVVSDTRSEAPPDRRRVHRDVTSIPQQPPPRKNNRRDEATAAYTSPIASMFNQFPNLAVEREIHKHDRYIVDSLAYLNRFNEDQAAEYTKQTATSQKHTAKPITIVVLTINRAVPYLAVLVAMLLRGHSVEVFMEKLDVHIVNIERRKGKSGYSLFDDLCRKLPFLTFHDWTATYEQHANIGNGKTWFYANQKVDYIRALGICKERTGSSWCVVMEDDAVPCVDFARKFDKSVNKEKYNIEGNRPITVKRGGAKVGAMGLGMKRGSTKNNEIGLDTVGMVKLYVPFNDGHAGGKRNILINNYVREDYDKDKVLDPLEANATGISAEKVEYQTVFSVTPGGAVAEAYPVEVLDRITDYLNKTISGGGPASRPVDMAISSDFMKHSNMERLALSPSSLVNHIGFISEHVEDVGLYDRISTDVRFQLDDGHGTRDNVQGQADEAVIYNGPVASMFNNFPNNAVERELHKHDRWIVDSIAYLNRFNETRAAEYTKQTATSQKHAAKPITIVVLTINRAIPYLAVLVAMLLRGHSVEVFMAKLDIHIVNIERRKGKSGYSLFDDLRRKLPFLTFHDWTAKYEQHSDTTVDTSLYLANQRLDYIRALGICKDAGSKWCVVMEDDAVPCVDFARKFDKYVNREKYDVWGRRLFSQSDAGDKKSGNKGSLDLSSRKRRNRAGNQTEEIVVANVGMIKLYVPFNDGHMKGPHDISLNEYAQGDYNKDKSLDLLEANAAGASVEKIDYRIMFSQYAFGAVAEAYPAGVLERIMVYLQKTGGTPKKVQGLHLKANSEMKLFSSSAHYIKAVDISLNFNFFKNTNLERLQMSPSSLVNHIGYSSENKVNAGLFDRISTDVRFQLDDGPPGAVS